MLITFKEASCSNIKELRAAYALLGGEVKINRWNWPHNCYLVDMQDGTELMNLQDPESSSGILFRIWKDNIEIRQLHTTRSRRKQGVGGNLLLPLIKFAEARNIKKFCLVSENDSFWKHMIKKYKQFVWEVYRSRSKPRSKPDELETLYMMDISRYK